MPEEPSYFSRSRGCHIPVRTMPVPHAARVLASLPADADPDLRAALEARAGLASSTEAEPRAVPYGGGVTLRGEGGKFAAVSRQVPRPEPEPVEHRCEGCGRELNPAEWILSPGICGACVRKRHRKAVQG
jgi:hypothetical protein